MSNAEVVKRFLKCWDNNDFDGAFAMMSADIVYKNSGYPDAIGHDEVRKTLVALINGTSPMTSIIHAIAENNDGIVMTERTDTIHLATGPLSFPVMGAFTIKNGLIAGWRDYFADSIFKKS